MHPSSGATHLAAARADRTGRLAGTSPRWAVIGLVALSFVLVDAAKPLVIDDAIYHEYARQIRHHPGDPYGFALRWDSAGTPAHAVVAPPALLYWWAGAIAVFGERPILWKLGLLPVALLLVWALERLFARFAPGFEIPLLCAAIFSPMLLPAFNLMLDVPALALGLAALALVIRAGDEDRIALAALGGLLGGLAMQTKYNAVVPVTAGLLWAALHRKWRHAAIAGTLAALLFVAWELFVLLRYGGSSFTMGLGTVAAWQSWPRRDWAFALLSILGAAAPASTLLGLIALGCSRRVVLAGAGAVALPLGLLLVAESLRAGGTLGRIGVTYPMPEQALFGLVGLVACGTMLRLCWRSIRASGRTPARTSRAAVPQTPAFRRVSPADLFLVAWLALEVVGYFEIAPFFATRRAIGIYVVSLLLAGRHLSRSAPSPEVSRTVPSVAAFCATIGVVFAVSDCSDARSELDALSRAMQRAAELEPGGEAATTWFAGRWGLTYYADRAGLRPFAPNASRLEPGDRLLVSSLSERPPVRIDMRHLQRVDVSIARSPWPWSTLPSAYAGPVPIRARRSVPFQISVYRVLRSFVPSGPTRSRSAPANSPGPPVD